MDYQKIYDRLIQKRILNKLQKIGDGSVETHHVKPRCLGGTDDIENLVNLSCREHYVAHLLLAKIYKETDYFEPLIYAIQCMQNSNGRNKRFRHSSRIFQKERMKAWKRNLQKMQDKRSKKITWRNETHTFREWGKILNIHPKTLANKYRSGKSLDEIIITTNRNTRNLIEFKGRKLTLKDWANELNISHSNLHNRIYHLGWSIEKAFTTPYMNPSEKHYKRKYLYQGKYYALKELEEKFNITGLRHRMNRQHMSLEQALTQPKQIQNIHFEYKGISYKSINEMLRKLKISKNLFFKFRKMGYSIIESIDLTISQTKSI